MIASDSKLVVSLKAIKKAISSWANGCTSNGGNTSKDVYVSWKDAFWNFSQLGLILREADKSIV